MTCICYIPLKYTQNPMSQATPSFIADLKDAQPYRHYSFDLWLTLIRSHPEFKQQRSLYFQQVYNPLGKPLEEVQRVFRKVDLMCNAINEKTGGNIDAEEMYLMVLHELIESNDYRQIDLEQLYDTVESMIFQYMPLVYSEHTIASLQFLKSRGAGLNLLSNTGFIKGRTLRKVLSATGLGDLFDFELYSDETGFSKPKQEMFALVWKQAQEQHASLQKEDILHIGDNVHADIGGAERFGFKAFLVHAT